MPTENKIPVPRCGERFKFMGWTCVRPLGHTDMEHSRLPIEGDPPTIAREAYNGHAVKD